MLRRKRERAIPESGTPEFDAAAQGSGAADEPERPRRREALMRAMGRRVPNSGGFGAGIPKKTKKTSPDE